MSITSLVGKANSTLRMPLTVFTVLGFWAPSHFEGFRKVLYSTYTMVAYLLVIGVFIIGQVGDLYQVWGNVSLMTDTSFLLLANLATSGKLLNIVLRKKQFEHMIGEVKAELIAEIREAGIEIVRRSDRETIVQMYGCFAHAYLTILGWIACVEKQELPMRAWYPYDVSKSPAYQITNAYQCIALYLECTLNISVDIFTITLIQQCRCRFQLVALSLTTLCDDAINDEETVIQRIRECVRLHQAALYKARQLQECFSYPVFGEFAVSMFILCLTAYQLAFESSNMMRVLSMFVFIMVVLFQVFLYCYHGNELLDESENIKEAAFQCPWYECTVRVQRMLVIIINRSYQVARLRAGGITEMSLVSFMAIIKTSYTLFTVLQQATE